MIPGLLLALLPLASCTPIQSEWIHGHDLAAANPAYSSLDQNLVIGASPVPGLIRRLSPMELKRIAANNHLSPKDFESVCFAWKTARLTESALRDSMLKALENQKPEIKILEWTAAEVPAGEIVFSASNLVANSEKPSLWRGSLIYGHQRSLPVWALVQVRVEQQHVAITSELAPQAMLEAPQLRLETYKGPPTRQHFINSIEEAEGRVLRRSLPAGSILTDEMLDPRHDVQSGELVSAVLESNGTRLEIQVLAEANGSKGQVISVRNTRSGRSFHARVERKGVVTVIPGGQYGLTIDARTAADKKS